MLEIIEEKEVSPATSEILEKAEAADNLDKVKKQRGRPRKDASQAGGSQPKAEFKSKPNNELPTKILCYPIVKVVSVSGELALKDKRAAMQPAEIELMAESMAVVFDKYLPQILGQYGAEIALCTAFAQYGTRLWMLSLQQQKERKEAAEKAFYASQNPPEQQARNSQPEMTL